ncbi:MAG TPA: hypothetical protein VLT33_22060 [Labilithrix sp.]|nr:hypothetical protein [Labilithrix sp.]
MRYVRAVGLASSLLLGLLATPCAALANGRFPESNAIFFAPEEPGTVVLRTTFGLLVSRDRGKAWDWVCEPALGLVGVEDPMLSITPDNTLIATTFQGLAVSRDRACSWAFVDGPPRGLVFIDSASRPASPGTVVAFASSFDGQDDAGHGVFRSTLFETRDEGRTFATLGPSLDPSLRGLTVDLTPSDLERVYVSALRDPGPRARAFLLTSRDHGATYEEHAVALLSPENGLYIAGVDPVVADRLYLRTSSPTDKPSRLLVTDDAGKTFRTLFTGAGALAGFATTSDGKKIWIGGPRDGLHVASTSDYAFVRRSTAEITCLAAASDGLWACSTEKSGFVLGLSADEGTTFAPKLHFCDVRGPLACPAGSSTYAQCTLGGGAVPATSPWPQQRVALGCESAAADAGASPGAETALRAGGGGCSLRAPAPLPLGALVAGVAAMIGLLRRRSI